MNVRVQTAELAENHLDPVVCVYAVQTKELVAQIFNFIDTLGGKEGVNADEIERFLQVRAVLEPKGSDYKQVLKYKKDEEAHSFVTKIAACAGEAFALDYELLDLQNARVEEMDANELIELDPATFKYEAGLIEVYRQCEDPFSNELASVKFE